MPRSLKVFRTPIGFHDAYVAAPSQKAALKAWGSDANLFSRGAAEQVTDPALTAEPLAHPGEVIRRTRGSTEEHLAALPRDKARRRAPTVQAPARRAPPKPRPSRDRIDALEQAAVEARQGFEAREATLRAREQAAATERRRLAAAYERDSARREAALEKERRLYAERLEEWRR